MPVKTLGTDSDYEEILERIDSLSPSDAARWGRMNVYKALCHVGDAMLVSLGEMTVSQASPLDPWRLTKWFALWGPWKWPRNLPTRPEMDQCRLAVAMGDFEAARRRTAALLLRLRKTDVTGSRHPLFRALTRAEWMRWGWLHADHHLRQFRR
jgi:hypothetical protein